MSSDFVIDLNHVSKVYRVFHHPFHRLIQFLVGKRKLYTEFTALKDISLKVRKGETVGVIGRNGSGKSTLLQLICGTLYTHLGDVTTRGKIAALLELGAGFNPEFTGRENVYLACSIYGLSSSQVDERFKRITDFAEIGDYIDQPVKTYSSGMFVRLAFAVIANVDADILIIDEALAVGDAFFTQKCMRFLKSFKNSGTVFFVSHDTASVTYLCDRAIWLDRGTLRADGDPKTVTEQYHASLYDEGSSVSPTHRTDSFGVGGAKILSASLVAADGSEVHVISGNEQLTLNIRCQTLQELRQFSVGYLVKDRKGQVIFGDNTLATFPAYKVAPGEEITASFTFHIPTLAAGDYVITVAVADGTQAKHTQHHWIHEALHFTSRPLNQLHGMLSVSCDLIQLVAKPTGLSEQQARQV